MKFEATCDGSIEPSNPGGRAVSSFIIRRSGKQSQVYRGLVDCGQNPDMTNNFAELAAVLGLVEFVHQGLSAWYAAPKYTHLLVKSDSKLVVNWVNLLWNCTIPRLRAMRTQILYRIRDFRTFQIEWIPRKENKEADKLSRVLYDPDFDPNTLDFYTHIDDLFPQEDMICAVE